MTLTIYSMTVPSLQQFTINISRIKKIMWEHKQQIHIHIHIHTHTHSSTPRMHTHKHTHTYTRAHIHTHTRKCGHTPHIHTHIQKYTNTQIHKYIRSRTYIFMHVHKFPSLHHNVILVVRTSVGVCVCLCVRSC